MLSVGNMPILENIIKNFSRDGYKNIVLCLNYKASVIKKYFGNGKNFGVNIEYVLEKNSLGTAGALSLIKRKIKEPFFVMNSDLLTNLNFRSLHNFHLSHNSLGTMCLKKINFQIPYGVVNLKGNNIEAIKEKPIQKFFINAGIYMLNPECLKKIKKNKFLNMTSLLENLIKEKKKINAFPLREYWLDIGRKEDYLKANDEFNSMIDV